ncbi:MAG: hypothetical protein JNL01_14460 [Bdellovibrionales bacterium]|nr:hypothetical protein [Bdellovibrionales bacterium]
MNVPGLGARNQVISVFLREFDLPRAEAELIFDDLLKWLEICRHPSRPAIFPCMYGIDQMWHSFILCTRAYAEFCADRFGDFVHHEPAVKEAPLLDHPSAVQNHEQLMATIQRVVDCWGPAVATRWFGGESPVWGRRRIEGLRRRFE